MSDTTAKLITGRKTTINADAIRVTQCAPSPPPFPLFLLVGGETPTKFSKQRGLTGPQLLEGGCW